MLLVHCCFGSLLLWFIVALVHCCFSLLLLLIHCCFSSLLLLVHCCFWFIVALVHCCFWFIVALVHCCFWFIVALVHCCFWFILALVHCCFWCCKNGKMKFTIWTSQRRQTGHQDKGSLVVLLVPLILFLVHSLYTVHVSLKGCLMYFLLFDKKSCKQTVYTLIRRSQIWVYTDCPIYGTIGINGLLER